MRVWIGVCFAMLILPALLYGAWRDNVLLSSDPDSIPRHAALLRYATAAGEQEFQAHCVQCHGSRGTGNPAHGVPNLSDGDWLYGEGAVSEIERIITYGIRSENSKGWNLARMPAFGTNRPPGNGTLTVVPLSPQQLRDVVEYLYFLEGRRADHDSATRGAKVYGNNGGCFDCHSSDARGDSSIGAPNLTDKIFLYGDGSREALYNSIANGRSGVCPAWITKMSPTEIRLTALYVYSLSHPSPSSAVSPLRAALSGTPRHD